MIALKPDRCLLNSLDSFRFNGAVASYRFYRFIVSGHPSVFGFKWVSESGNYKPMVVRMRDVYYLDNGVVAP